MSDRWPGGIIRSTPVVPTGPFENGTAPGVWTMDQAAYWIKQGLWPTQGVQTADPYFPYTTLLLSSTSLGNANNNLFVDSSGAFNPISRNGNTTQGSATPYSANWSNYFDGSGDYLTVPSNAAFAYGTGDFTWEMWVFPTAASWTTNNYYLMDHGSNGGTLSYYQNVVRYYNPTTGIGSALYTNGGSIPANQWTHVAVSRSGGTTSLFVNGALRASASDGYNYGTAAVTIANYGGGGVEFQGYISNTRIVKGTAVYTGAFTPPTSALTAISGTSLLTCQSNRFRDASSNNFTITRNGDTRVTDFSPFSPSYPGVVYNQSDITNWSGYFDGSGDWLSAPSGTAFAFGTGDFTMEAWVYRPATGDATILAPGGGPGLIFYNVTQLRVLDTNNGNQLLADTDAFPLNQWVHVACTRASGTMRLFVNGALKASGSVTNNFTSVGVCYVGSWDGTNFNWTGSISNARIVKGTAVYTSAFTPPTTNLTAISGTSLLTCQNAAFTDNSTNNFILTQNGNPTVTGNSPFNTVGYWSNYFDGSGDYLSAPSNAAFAYGTGNFTVELWFFASSVSGAEIPIYKQHNGGAAAGDTVEIRIASSKIYGYIENTSFGGTTTLSPNTWYHVAYVRNGSTCTLYLNGVSEGSASNSLNISTNPTTVRLGTNQGAANFFNGYISNARVVKGTAVYTANFTPPTTPLTAISGTSLLTCQNGQFIDNSTNSFTITRTGDVSIQSFDPFYTSTIASNGGSMYFDGSGDYLSVPNSPTFNLSNNNFTLECWVYNNSISGDTGYMGIWDNGYILYRESSTYKFYYYGPGFSNITASVAAITGAWTHLAVVRNGSTMTFYINGTSAGTASIGTTAIGFPARPFILGANWNNGSPASFLNGYMSNARLVNGTAVYTANFTPPTAPTAPTASTNLLVNGMNAGIYDATAINDMETIGNAQVTTAVSKFGGSSVYFDGTGDVCLISPNNLLVMDASDFTAEFWVNFTSKANYAVMLNKTGQAFVSVANWIIQLNSTATAIVFALGQTSASGVGSWISTALLTSTTNPVNGTWYHVAVTKAGTTYRMFINGTLEATATNASVPSDARQGKLSIGADIDPAYGTMTGYIDDVRITKGIARYTSSFTPPTQAFPTY